MNFRHHGKPIRISGWSKLLAQDDSQGKWTEKYSYQVLVWGYCSLCPKGSKVVWGWYGIHKKTGLEDRSAFYTIYPRKYKEWREREEKFCVAKSKGSHAVNGSESEAPYRFMEIIKVE